MISRLFVYGTLGPGQSHEYLLKQVPGRWRQAKVRGNLYPVGVEPIIDYPVIELDLSADFVQGHVYCSRQLTRLWQQLDTYEGEDYRRVLTQVHLTSGKETSGKQISGKENTGKEAPGKNTTGKKVDAYIYVVSRSVLQQSL